MKRELLDHTPVTRTTVNPAPADAVGDARLCRTARFRPFGFRIHARPGRRPRLAARGLRGDRTAIWLEAITHN